MLRLLAAVAAVIVVALPAATAHAAGVTTHAFMADKGREYVDSKRLRELLDRHRNELISGAAYPDGGYGSSSYPGGDYGEISHWERFVDAYVEALRAKDDCDDLLDPEGPCAPQVAHLMGVAAHGVGDEMWDWLFEPHAADFGESPDHPYFASGLPGAAELASVPPGSLINTIEYAMDMIAIVDHLRAQELSLILPDTDVLLDAYRRAGREDVTRDGILAGHAIITAAVAGERVGAATDYARVKMQMPMTAARMYAESGAVVDVAQAAAGYYEAVWEKLAGDRPRPRVVAVHPEAGERGVPWDWSARRTSPGPLGGGAQERIVAVLSTALAYPPSEHAGLAPEAFRLIDEVTGEDVPQLEGFPRPGPYGNGDGTHSMMLYPAGNLEPCRWYRVVVGESARNVDGLGPEPHEWRFQTRAAGDGPAPEGCLREAEPAPHADVANEPTPGPLITDALARLPQGDADSGHGHGHGHEHGDGHRHGEGHSGHHRAMAAYGRGLLGRPSGR